MCLIVIPMASIWMFGRVKHATVVFLVMLSFLVLKAGVADYFESAPTAVFAGLNIEETASNLEGKELSFGAAGGSAWGVLTACSSNGSVGSKAIAQAFTRPEYFWPRPSAVDYNAAAAGGSNLSPASDKLCERAAATVEHYGATADAKLSADPATASGAGLAPHISLRAAKCQAPRIAEARGLSEVAVTNLTGKLVFHPGGPLPPPAPGTALPSPHHSRHPASSEQPPAIRCPLSYSLAASPVLSPRSAQECAAAQLEHPPLCCRPFPSTLEWIILFTVYLPVQKIANTYVL